MDEPSYGFTKIEDKLLFEFESISDEKCIKKLIEYRLINDEISLYNLALVDILLDGTVSDLSVSDNKDMPKVLATVFQSIIFFFQKNPHARIFIQGSTLSRTRLYQIAIAKYLEEIEQKFKILGFIDNDVEVFSKGKNYESFVISLK